MAASRRGAVLLLVVAVSIAAAVNAAALEAIPTTRIAGGGVGDGHQLGWFPGGRSGCRGTIAECLGGEEFELESESSRRFLATTNYISYDSLKRDSVPCSQPGASYYNCRPGAAANPYTRGCSAITKCRT